jgi:hypothetical protein
VNIVQTSDRITTQKKEDKKRVVRLVYERIRKTIFDYRDLLKNESVKKILLENEHSEGIQVFSDFVIKYGSKLERSIKLLLLSSKL